MKNILILATVIISVSAFSAPTINIYNGTYVHQLQVLKKKGKLVYRDGEKESFLFYSSKAKRLYNHLRFISDFFYDEFAYDSWNGRGDDINATYNVSKLSLVDLLGLRQNAAWTGSRFIFGSGKRKGLDDMEKALDVVAHEYTHAVIQHTSKLKYEGQSGALNEHFADVFGSIVHQRKYPDLSNPYLIGQSILNGDLADKHHALRDMMDPSKGLVAQPSHLEEVLTNPSFQEYGPWCTPSTSNDNCGVHILSGIPNRASALVMSQIGPEEASKLYFNVMVSLEENSNFSDYRVALMKECKNFASDTCYFVDEALKNVGL